MGEMKGTTMLNIFKKSPQVLHQKEMESHYKEVEERLSTVYAYMRQLDDYKIELLAIGDDAIGGSVQIRNKLFDCAGINSWIGRAHEKIKKMSWIHIEVSGHDNDGDYRSHKFEFSNKVGDSFLYVCANAPMNETPLHHMLSLELLKS